jgi:acyl-CoA synthetase (AMP-forming)/AMP-acid ligase II
MALFPGATFYFTYGLTEMGPRVTTFAAGSAASPHPILREETTRPVPIGAPISGVECVVRDGRLVVKSPYAARDLPIGPDGFMTADAAAILPSGAFEVRGRVDEAIMCGGLNVHAEDVERAALAVPGIARACAVGVPSELYGEIVVLLCEPEPAMSKGALDSALASALAASLPPTHLPKSVRFVERLPHTAAGKVLRREARMLLSS